MYSLFFVDLKPVTDLPVNQKITHSDVFLKILFKYEVRLFFPKTYLLPPCQSLLEFRRSPSCLMSESIYPLPLPPQASNFIEKETQTLVFSCEFCKIFENIFFKNTSGGCTVIPNHLIEIETKNY